MSVTSPGGLQEVPPRSPGRVRRWPHRAAIALGLLPVVILAGLVMAPVWIHDQHLNALAEEFLHHPLPPNTEFADEEVQASVALRGNSNHCDYRLRFNLATTLPVDEIVRHYADIGPVVVWTSSEKLSYPLPPGDDQRLIIVEIQHYYQDPSWDLRCH